MGTSGDNQSCGWETLRFPLLIFCSWEPSELHTRHGLLELGKIEVKNPDTVKNTEWWNKHSIS